MGLNMVLDGSFSILEVSLKTLWGAKVELCRF